MSTISVTIKKGGDMLFKSKRVSELMQLYPEDVKPIIKHFEDGATKKVVIKRPVLHGYDEYTFYRIKDSIACRHENLGNPDTHPFLHNIAHPHWRNHRFWTDPGNLTEIKYATDHEQKSYDKTLSISSMILTTRVTGFDFSFFTRYNTVVKDRDDLDEKIQVNPALTTDVVLDFYNRYYQHHLQHIDVLDIAFYDRYNRRVRRAEKYVKHTASKLVEVPGA